jgi:hypothetical protein
VVFQLIAPTIVTLKAVSLRREVHGKAKIPALDLKVTLETSNLNLALLSDKLLKALYHREQTIDDQADVPGIEQVLPNLLFPQLSEVHWALELSGMDMALVYGLGDERSNSEFPDVKVNNFRLRPKEGGTVYISFRVQSNHVPDGAVDKLHKQLDQQIEITLVRNETLREQAVIDGSVGHEGLAAMQDEQDATDAFLDSVGDDTTDDSGPVLAEDRT